MAHDALWLSIRSVHPDEITVHMEEGSNPDGSEVGNTASRTWNGLCRASPSVVSALLLTRFRRPAQVLLPHGIPALALLVQILGLLFLQGRSLRFNLSHIAFSSAVSFGDV